MVHIFATLFIHCIIVALQEMNIFFKRMFSNKINENSGQSGWAGRYNGGQ